jgi:3D (Asp-Asp-Asp) domain-containing protein
VTDSEDRVSIVASVGDLIGAGVSFLADLVSRIVNGIAGLVPAIALGAMGCSGPKVESAKHEPAAISEHAKPVESAEPQPIGKFDITFYYVIGEEEVARMAAKKAAANDNAAIADEAKAGTNLAAVTTPPELITIYEPKSCTAISEVTRDFLIQLELQGTGKLRDGRVLNIWGACPCERKPCFKVIGNQWGTAGSGKPLQPFRTVAVDRRVVKLGSLLYVPLLEGRTMPGRPPWGGFVHDGCVVADDTGGGINGNQLDLFVGRKGYFLGLSGSRGSHAWARHVPVYDGSKLCERKGRKIGRRAAAI